MITLFIIIWLLLGIIALWRTYYGWIKEWYLEFNDDLRKNRLYNSHLIILLILSPLFLLGGLLSLIYWESLSRYNTWYYKIPK